MTKRKDKERLSLPIDVEDYAEIPDPKPVRFYGSELAQMPAGIPGYDPELGGDPSAHLSVELPELRRCQLGELDAERQRFRPLGMRSGPTTSGSILNEALERDSTAVADLLAGFEDLRNGFHVELLFEDARERVADELGLRGESTLLRRLFQGAGLLFRQLEAHRLHSLWYYHGIT